MNKMTMIVGCVLSLTSFSSGAWALDGVTIEAGHTNESTDTLRIGAQFDFGSVLWRSKTAGVVLDGYWDAGLTHWGGLDAGSLSLTPVFTLRFPGNGGMTPFVEGGIGAALFSRTNLDDHRDIGSRFQFEDRIGAGVRFDSGSELGLRYYHYSNAGIKQPNQGINKAAAYYRFRF